MYSNEYISQLQKLHTDRRRSNGFGGKSKKLGKFHDYMKQWKPKTLLDYGCGKGHILANLKETYPNTVCIGYDPAVPMFNTLTKRKFECVFSNDVLEHIEPVFIKEVLTHINNLSTNYIWLRIDTMPARKKLPDGRNAHLIQESEDWWINIIKEIIDGEIVFFETNKKGKFDVAIEK